ncbi:hypothetical protein V5O48_008046 [Marasmius crinis-equi]|uniref:Senescence domain-containing protein n=1 Tax=Marasmius crinis-equi TaxID=585013 RepID=A0ABR3FEY3_9AGAR
MTSITHDAFLLLNLPNCTLKTPTASQTGTLGLECVTLPPSAQATFDRDVFLVLRLNNQEFPLHPARTVSVSQNPNGERVYVCHGTETDPLVITLVFSESLYTEGPMAEDIETFDSVLGQYLNLDVNTPSPPSTPPKKDEDLRGRLLLRDEDTGEIVGELDRKVVVREDPVLSERGHENDPVVIEIPEDATTTPPETAIEAFAISVPPDEQNWMTKSATLVSQGITGGTNLLVRVITSASSYYIARSTPSTSTPASPVIDKSNPSYISEKSSPNAQQQQPAGQQPPSRAVMFLTSERTRKGLTKVHAVSGQAATLSSKTIAFIDDVISRAVGGGSKGKGKPDLPARRGLAAAFSSTSSSSSSLAPPPYSSNPNLSVNPDAKPPLPPRAPSPTPSPVGGAAPPLPPRKLGTKARIVLSADLILSTIEESTKKIINISADRADAMIRHKHGEQVAESSKAMAGTARNIGLVYVDLQGIGRKAIVKRVAKTYVKTRVKQHREARKEGKQ